MSRFTSVLIARARRNQLRAAFLALNTLFLWSLQPALLSCLMQREQPASQQLEVLKLQVPLDKALGGGDAHSYGVVLHSGQFLRVTVEQQGIDVVVTLIAPGGDRVLQTDSPNGAEGPEPVSWIAEVPGTYLLEVRSVEKGATPGKYRVTLDALRLPTPQDRTRLAAELAFGTAQRLLNSSKEDELVKAVNKYEEAFRLWQSLSDQYWSTIVTTSLNSLALRYLRSAVYDKAEQLLVRVWTMREQALGKDHPLVAQSLNNLGSVYRNKGDYVQAEPLLKRALDIREEKLGKHHIDVATTLSNLGGLYQLIGDYTRAEPLMKRALEIREKELGSNNPQVARSLNNLALLYMDMKQYSKAETLFQRALPVLEKSLPAEDPLVVQVYENIALLHTERSDYVVAERLLDQTLKAREKAFGPTHPDVANSLNNLASVYFLKGEFDRSALTHQRALKVWEEVLGPEHPLACRSRNNLAQVYDAMGETADAFRLLALNSKARERNLDLILRSGSEQQKLSYIATLSEETDYTITFHLRSAPRDPQASHLALETILRRKGRVLDVIADSMDLLRRNSRPEDRELIEQLSTVRSKLAKIILDGIKKNDSARQSEVIELEQKAEQIEAVLSTRSAEFRSKSQPVTIQSVQRAIPSDMALVEFASYRPFNLRAKRRDENYGKPRYVAYVLRNNGHPLWIELGDTAVIDRMVASFREALSNPNTLDVHTPARQLDEAIMRPVRRLLGKTRKIIISPEGSLNLMPFAALTNERNEYLVRDYSFTYVTSGRDLLRLQVQRQRRQPPVIIADPRFGDESDNDITSGGRKVKEGSAKEIAAFSFSRLPGAAEEAEALKAILKGATVFTDEAASEIAIKRVSGPSILHVATHGFFWADERRVTSGLSADPLLRSGLALAGANSQQDGRGEDGILTALEAASLDLFGTKLVVLSACETGVGDVRTGEGVYGLRRALMLAGAESQIMSLWQVSDEATRDIMITVYRRLIAGDGPTDALRHVQLTMINYKERGKDSRSRAELATVRQKAGIKLSRGHPYYWASFIQSGAWAPFDKSAFVAKQAYPASRRN